MLEIIKNANSIDQVVDAINDSDNPEYIAYEYGLDAAEDSGYSVTKEAIEAHMQYLVEAGANFDLQKALSFYDNNTTAEKVALRFKNDGTCFEDDEETRLEDYCEKLGGEHVKNYNKTLECKYVFDDGSVIVVSGDCWDLGYKDCFCMRGVGHQEDCTGEEDIEGIILFEDLRDALSNDAVLQDFALECERENLKDTDKVTEEKARFWLAVDNEKYEIAGQYGDVDSYL